MQNSKKKLSPFGVFCLLCPVIAVNGPVIIDSLAMVLLAAYICYIIHSTVTYSFCAKVLGGMNPAKFFKEMLPAIMFAFTGDACCSVVVDNLERKREARKAAKKVVKGDILCYR